MFMKIRIKQINIFDIRKIIFDYIAHTSTYSTTYINHILHSNIVNSTRT